MTVNGHRALYCTKYASFSTDILMKIDLYYQQQKCGTLSFWQCKVYADIHGDSLEEGITQQCGFQKRQFSLLSVTIFRVPTTPGKSLKVLDFWSNFQAWKVPKNDFYS